MASRGGNGRQRATRNDKASDLLPAFPYKDLRLSEAQAVELADRIDSLREALTDAVGLSGHLLQMDDASVANIASHLALAGARVVDDELAYIWGRRAAPDSTGMWRVEIEWLLKQKHTPVPQPKTDADEAARIRAELIATVPAGILDALREQLIVEATAEATLQDEAGETLAREGD